MKSQLSELLLVVMKSLSVTFLLNFFIFIFGEPILDLLLFDIDFLVDEAYFTTFWFIIVSVVYRVYPDLGIILPLIFYLFKYCYSQFLVDLRRFSTL